MVLLFASFKSCDFWLLIGAIGAKINEIGEKLEVT